MFKKYESCLVDKTDVVAVAITYKGVSDVSLFQ